MDYSDEDNRSDGELLDDILGPEDLFNDEADEDESVQDHQSKTSDKNETEKEDTKEKEQKKIRQPRIVRNPRVTLNVNALSGKNGLSALKKLFTDFKFKGNGHEKEDLTKILGILQQWMCYQLCPSYSFESCMLQLEVLGKKKAVQTLMKKYRLGIDDWGENKSDIEDDSEINNAMETDEHVTRTDDFDLLRDEEISNAENDTELSQGDVTGEPTVNPVDDEITLTPEQLERIARNRKLAEERRQKIMSAHFEHTEVNKVADRNDDQDDP